MRCSTSFGCATWRSLTNKCIMLLWVGRPLMLWKKGPRLLGVGPLLLGVPLAMLPWKGPRLLRVDPLLMVMLPWKKGPRLLEVGPLRLGIPLAMLPLNCPRLLLGVGPPLLTLLPWKRPLLVGIRGAGQWSCAAAAQAADTIGLSCSAATIGPSGGPPRPSRPGCGGRRVTVRVHRRSGWTPRGGGWASGGGPPGPSLPGRGGHR